MQQIREGVDDIAEFSRLFENLVHLFIYIYIYVLIRYISVYPRTKAWRIVIQKSLSNIITHPQRHLVLLHALYLFIP